MAEVRGSSPTSMVTWVMYWRPGWSLWFPSPSGRTLREAPAPDGRGTAEHPAPEAMGGGMAVARQASGSSSARSRRRLPASISARLSPRPTRRLTMASRPGRGPPPHRRRGDPTVRRPTSINPRAAIPRAGRYAGTSLLPTGLSADPVPEQPVCPPLRSDRAQAGSSRSAPSRAVKAPLPRGADVSHPEGESAPCPDPDDGCRRRGKDDGDLAQLGSLERRRGRPGRPGAGGAWRQRGRRLEGPATRASGTDDLQEAVRRAPGFLAGPGAA